MPVSARPSRMPLCPIPPLLAMAGVIIALTKQKGSTAAPEPGPGV